MRLLLRDRIRSYFLALLLLMAAFAVPHEASASHYRYGNITWSITNAATPRVVTFHVSMAFRRSFYTPTPTVGGAAISSGVSFNYGDGSSAPINLTVTSIDPASDLFFGEATLTHTYAGTATQYNANYASSARIATVQNNANGSFANFSIVTLGATPPNNSPVTSSPPIINVVTGNAAATFQIAASDPDNQALTYRFATASEMGGTGLTQPTGMSVSTSGLVTFNTVGKAVNNLYNAAYVITDAAGATTMLDVLVRIVAPSTPPVFDYSVTPANNTVYNLQPGQPVSFSVKAYDTDPGDVVTLNAVGVPSGATLAPALPASGNPVSTTFSWTPTASQLGSRQITFVATDVAGTQTTTTVTINTTLRPVFDVPPTPVLHNESCIPPGVAHQETIKAHAPDPNVTLSISRLSNPMGETYTPSLPTSSANTSQTTMSWTPAVPDFGPNTFKYRATDNLSNSTDHDFTLVVNSVPSFTSTQGNTTVNVGQQFTYNISVTDPDLGYGDTLDIDATTIPSWLTLNYNLGDTVATLSGTPSAADVGTNHVQLDLEDIYHHCHNQVVQAFDINVVACTTTAVCQNITVNLSASGQASIIPGQINNGSSDNCGSALTLHASRTSFTCADLGTQPVILTASNIYMDSSTCTATVTVIDNTAPAITCPANVTVSCTASTSPSHRGAATATDNCGSPVITYTDVVTAGTCAGNYTIARTWTATDPSNNASSCVQTITVQDLTAPVITCPANVTLNCTASTTPAATGAATAQDNCSGATVTYTDATTSGTCAGNYTIARTWTATDGCGNTSTCVQTITVQDLTAPVIACPSDKTLDCTASTAPAATGTATATDNCSGATVTYTDATTSGTCPGNYVITRTWKATDGCGNFSTCAQTLTVQDLTAPVIACPANKTVDCATGTAPSATGTATATDNCSGATISYTDATTNGSCAGNYVVTRTWKATDACGNFSTCVQTITVQDQTGPVMTCPGTIAVSCTGSRAPSATGMATAIDACSGVANVAYSDFIATGSCAGNYLVIRMWNATDNCGNISYCSQYIIVNDNTAPVITCPANKTIACAVGTAPANTGTATATDGCSGATVTYTDATTSGNCPGNYVVTRTWKATDGCGNFSTCVQTITVQDLTAPVITCPANKTIACTANSQPTASGTGMATAQDDCSGVVTLVSSDVVTAGNCAGNYSIARTWTATDGCGNTSSCVQTITVQDLTAPVITCPANKTIACGTSTLPASNGTATAVDDCSGATVTYTDATTSGTCTGNYSIARTWTATDGCGNTSTCIQTITVQDLTAPVIACPSNKTIACGTSSLPAATGTATATDNCSGATVTYTDATTSGTCAGNYSIARTWTATDGCGNTSTCIQTITVQDLTAPVIACPSNKTVTCGTSTLPANTGTATATDGCSGATVTYTDATTSGNCPGNYSIARTWKATDGCGNVSTCVQTITIQDLTAPVITCPSNKTIACSTSTLPAATGTATATDNCSGATITYTDVTTAGTCVGNYSITRTWKATDGCGNTSSCVQTITIQDLTAPVLACPSNKTVDCSASTTPANTGTATATDGCSSATVTYTDVTAAGTCVGSKVITRTWKATDACGNFSTCAQTITVQDNTAPTAMCKNITVTLVNGAATITAAQVDNGSSDNCSGIASLTLSKTSFNCTNIGSNTVTLTVKDSCGNTATCTSTVMVVGTTPSCSITVTPCNSTYTGGVPTNIYLGYGPQTATATASASGGSGFTYSWSPSTNLSCATCANPVFTPTAAGNYVYTVTAKNSYGCTSTCTVIFCVKDIRERSELPCDKDGYTGRVWICHSNGYCSSSIAVLPILVPLHLNYHNGDVLGKCSQACGTAARMAPVADNILGDAVKVYPNPNNGLFTIELPYIEDQALINVVDVTGKVIQRKVVTDADGNKLTMDLGDVSRGVYFVEVIYGDERFKTKMIVQ